ncbi:MAG: hypothetical protein JNK33_05300 [Candidatus Doudnabacteria bacterium]|nr:hypothetical protein [Candidatus Doudnabacteria bacterium]
MSEEEKKSISQNVLEQINSGQIKPTSRAYFVFRVGVFTVAMVVLVLLVIYTSSLVFFGLRSSGAWFAPGFGLSATRSALLIVPWVLVGCVVAAVVVLELLVKRFGFAYRRPAIYSVAGIALLVVVVGYAVALTPLHRSLYRQVHNGAKPPFWGGLYKNFDAGPGHALHAGFVNDLAKESFLLNAREGADFLVYITPTTQLPRERAVREGDFVLVFGSVDRGSIRAAGVRFAPDEMHGFGKRHPRHRMQP